MSALSFITADPDQGGELRPAVARQKLLAQRVPMGWLLGLLVGWLALDMLLLWRFLGLSSPALWLGGIALSALLVRAAAKAATVREGPTVGMLLACIAIAMLVLALGGEGRFFYANPDWRVRDALLHDMAIHPWPYAYATPDGIELLRAPIAMYLLPALGGTLWGQAGADLSLLAQNAILDGVLLSLGSLLFATRRAKLVALGCFLAFSGFDILGQLLRGNAGSLTPTAHLEAWGITQYSSTITLFFWVPQHAFAGWSGALALLLWRDGRVRIGGPLMVVPLVTLWSPLAAMGLMPFILWAGLDALFRRRLSLADIGSAFGAALLAIPALLYLKSGGDSVGAGLFPMAPAHYLLFETIEVLPLLLVAAAGARGRFGGMLFAITALSLLLIPFGRIGWSVDFAMRASIPALAILSVQFAEALASAEISAARRRIGIACLLIGSVTGLTEIGRALTFPTSPAPRCPLTGQWLGYPDFIMASSTYAAPLTALPPAIRPADPAIVPLTPACRDGRWPLPALFH